MGCDSEKPSVLLFVYGTLKRGENNYAWWMADPCHATFIATAQTCKRYPLFVNLLPGSHDCSPCLLDKPEDGGEERNERNILLGSSVRSGTPNDNNRNNNCRGSDDGDGPAASHFVIGEMFMVTEAMKKWLDVLEGVESGTYTTGGIDVVPLYNREMIENMVCLNNDGTVNAQVYFRQKDYPEDWNSMTPLNSTRLLQRFSAAECLRAYGSRFNGYPAHVRLAARLQEGLNKVGCPYSGLCGVPIRPKPIVFFIIDGVGDSTYVELNNRTPLEAVAGVPFGEYTQTNEVQDSRKGNEDCRSSISDSNNDISKKNSTRHVRVSPGINVVAENGVSGLMDAYEAGVACGSDTAHLALLGYPPKLYYGGRGAYEALGAGLELGKTDIAFKSNFAVFDEATGIVTHRRCDRDFTAEGPVLAAFLDGTVIGPDEYNDGDYDNNGKNNDRGGVKRDGGEPYVVRVQYATEHRCGVAIAGPGLSPHVTGTDPLADGRPLRHCAPAVDPRHNDYAAARHTSRVVNAAARRLTARLRDHPINMARMVAGKPPANTLLLRGASTRGEMPPLAVRHGLVGAVVAPTCIIRGLAASCGLSPVDAPGATGDYETNVHAKVKAALQALGLRSNHTKTKEEGKVGEETGNNFVVIHVKGVDDAGHDRSLDKKIMMLQKCGEAMQQLWDALPDGSTMVVLADHSTPVSLGDHSCEPVPVSIATKGHHSFTRDDVMYYSEVESSRGALGRFRGEELIGVVKRVHHWYHYAPQCVRSNE